MINRKHALIFLVVLFISLQTIALPTPQNPVQGKTKVIHWTMVTAWPKNFPLFQTSAEKLADDIRIITQGQLDITVIDYDKFKEKYQDANKTNSFEDIFNAVSEKKYEMGHATAYYWVDNKTKKVPGCEFFSTVPFGLNAEGMYAWIYIGGGLEMWKELYGKHNLIPFPVGNTGPAMGGWFKNKIIGPDYLKKGLKIRIAGIGGKVYQKAGNDTVLIPASELQENFEKGDLDVAVFQGPYHDQWLNLDKCGANYYYYPGWHEPGTVLELIINKQAWESLPAHLQETIKVVVGKSYNEIYNQFEQLNFKCLKEMEEQQGEIVLKPFPDEVLEEFRQLTRNVLETEAQSDPQFNKIYMAYKKFEASNEKWRNISSGIYRYENTERILDKFMDELKASSDVEVWNKEKNLINISLIKANFVLGSKDLTPEQTIEIKRITSIIKKYYSFIKAINVQDDTYDKGAKWRNSKLSKRRVEAIKKLLIEELISASLIKTFPQGESKGDPKRKSKTEIIIEFKED